MNCRRACPWRRGRGGSGYLYDLPASTASHATEVFPTPCSSGSRVPHRRRSAHASRVAACHPGALAARALACFAVPCTVADDPATSVHRSRGVVQCSATAILPAHTATWQWCLPIQLSLLACCHAACWSAALCSSRRLFDSATFEMQKPHLGGCARLMPSRFCRRLSSCFFSNSSGDPALAVSGLPHHGRPSDTVPSLAMSYP